MDWLISRQRHYGVSFPVWYCESCGDPVLASEEQLPVDPDRDYPQNGCACGGDSFIPEKDVMDTWATSSLTPQIACGWLEDEKLYARTFPMALRSQAHEIIRTWAFYTIVKSIHHFNELPWKDVVISGWGLAPTGSGKISKSRGGGPVAPLEMIEKTSADAVRYWAASTGIGKDAIISEEKIKAGSKLVTKLWNVAKFSERFLCDYKPPEKIDRLFPIDNWILLRLQSTIDLATNAFLNYDYLSAKNEVETLFWQDLADNYLELVKFRLYGDDGLGKGAAQYTLYHTLLAILKLFAPFIPHITEVVFREIYAEKEDYISIHGAEWPKVSAIDVDKNTESFGLVVLQVLTAVRRYKSENQLPLSADLDLLEIIARDQKLRDFLRDSRIDLRSATRSKEIELVQEFSQEAATLINDGDFGAALVVEDLSEI